MRGRPTVNVACITLRTGGPERTKQGKDAASTLFPLFTFWLTITWTRLLCSATHYLPWQTGLTEIMSQKSKQNKTIQYKKAASSQVVCLFVCFFSGKKSNSLSYFQDFPIVNHAAVGMKVRHWCSNFLATFFGKWLQDHPVSIFNLGGICILLSTKASQLY